MLGLRSTGPAHHPRPDRLDAVKAGGQAKEPDILLAPNGVDVRARAPRPGNRD